MSKSIQINDIEQNIILYLQDLEEIVQWLSWYERELDRIAEYLWGIEINQEEYSDIENWYSD